MLKKMKKIILLALIIPSISNAEPELGVIITPTSNSGIHFVALAVRDTHTKQIDFLRGVMPDNEVEYRDTVLLTTRFNRFEGVGIRKINESNCTYNTSNFTSILKKSNCPEQFDNKMRQIKESYENKSNYFRRWEYEGFDYARAALEQAEINIPSILNTSGIKCTRCITRCVKENKKHCPSNWKSIKTYLPSNSQIKKLGIVSIATSVTFAAWYFNPYSS